MAKILLVVGGVANGLMTLFHVWLNYEIFRIQALPSDLQALLEMFSVLGTLTILFFAVVSLACVSEMLTTRLGMVIAGLVVLVYASRAVEEVVLSPVPSRAVLALCVLIALIYVAVPLAARRRRDATPAARAA